MSIARCLLPTALFILAAHGICASSHGADPLLEKWQQGTDEYRATRERLTENLVKLFDVAEAKAKNAGNTQLTNQLMREKTDFTTLRILPRHVNTIAYTRGMSQALFKLRQLAVKTKAGLEKAERGKDAVKIDLEFDQALGAPPPPTPMVQASDPRTYWISDGETNHFRLLTDGTWHECGPTGEERQIWQEMGRTATSIELFDSDRKFAMKLDKTQGSVDYSNSGTTRPRYSLWKHGQWISTEEANAILDEQAERLGVGTPVIQKTK